MRIFERFRQQPGNGRHGLIKGEVLGDIAGLIAVHKRQARLILDRDLPDDDPLQLGVRADVLGQHQLDEGVLSQPGFQQVQKLRTMIRHGRGGGSSH